MDLYEGLGAANWSAQTARYGLPLERDAASAPNGSASGASAEQRRALGRSARRAAARDSGRRPPLGSSSSSSSSITLATRPVAAPAPAPSICYISESLIRRQANHPAGPLREITSLDLHLKGRRMGKIRFLEHLGALTGLTELNLSYNVIAKIEHLDKLSLLRDLNLAENQLKRIENLECLTRLERLNLSGNKISRVPRSMRTLRRLAVLRLARNELNCLEDFEHLAPLKALTSLSMHDNPVARLPQARAFAIFTLRSLDALDGQEVDGEDRRDADNRYGQGAKADALRAQLGQEEKRRAAVEANLAARDDERRYAEEEAKTLRSEGEQTEVAKRQLLEELDAKSQLLDAKTAELTRANQALYKLEQEVAYAKIDGAFPPQTAAAGAGASAGDGAEPALDASFPPLPLPPQATPLPGSASTTARSPPAMSGPLAGPLAGPDVSAGANSSTATAAEAVDAFAPRRLVSARGAAERKYARTITAQQIMSMFQ